MHAPQQSTAGSQRRPNIVALSGGVGGAKLAAGLDAITRADGGKLTVAVNTGDDFEHLGLKICPDLDSVLYALARLNDPARGWGRANETWHFMRALQEIGGEDWFSLGDRDLAMHVERTHQLRKGIALSRFTADVAARLGIHATILPATDDVVRTLVHTEEGALPFQDYFVKRRCEPTVRHIDFPGAAEARPHPALLQTLADPALDAIVICPSNPYLSIDPILALPGLRAALRHASAPVIAVSPIVGGDALKGPAAKIMRELGAEITPAAIASHYQGVIDALVIDERDSPQAARLDLPVLATRTLMHCLQDKEFLAREVLVFAREIARRPATLEAVQ
ncbi:Phosphoenolpyruvate transferase [Cupriavidus yeoncheonensis]|uniref:Phosphoenolpyruvate transferase n=1 Tax=Cupriavidus yeoncheonensis TaxID=1462994 RepID=A0A916J0K3_9BURK|nr:2-phospho-L-lactate transferase [Cupriavidus yeoncheonensis]CAG2157667.1 Phosphoenolpyruvate transferase [Cupriavidus yeoncheonensis]